MIRIEDRTSFPPILNSAILPAAASAVAAAIAKIVDELVHRIRNGCNYYQKCNYLLPHNFFVLKVAPREISQIIFKSYKSLIC